MSAPPPRVRFAPSPSGYLHIGGARTALFNWLWARKLGGQFVLRVEDTDQDRSSLESVQAILDAMRWLGLDWDEGPEVGGPHAPYFQSDRKAIYRSHVEQLIAAGKAYRCSCTKEELDLQREALKAQDPKAQFRYPGTCRGREVDPSAPHVVRFIVPEEGSTAWDDRVFGRIETPNKEQQDFVIMRRDGLPLYNFAAVVDDHLMQISLVVRGRDHIGNTPHQVMLYDAFGWEPPEFAHLPMMLSPKGEKLSKRHGDIAVQDYRARGYSPMGVLNYLARFGWSFGDQEIFSREELTFAFDFSRVNRSDGKFDDKKFADVNFAQLMSPKLTPDADYIAQVKPVLEAEGLTATDAQIGAALPLIRERARDFKDAAKHLDFYFREPPIMDEKAASKFLVPQAAEHLSALRALYAGFTPWEAEALEARLKAWLEETGHSMKEVAQPLRVALTGRTASPGLFEVMVVLGEQRSLARLDAAIRRAQVT
ncbi:MAG: glutamate--tRNA ligase [Polyangiaceae bacterium]|nr:glutamate--tRNA ligase [Polyangiaceae bacterium]MCW5792608.1 glutamate--tRNA ligase [Polyangiaceae bacterium]